MKARRYIAATAAIVATLVLSTTVPAHAAPGGSTHGYGRVTVDDTGRIHYGIDLTELPGASLSTERGVRDERGSCSFKTDRSGRAGTPKVLVITEVSFDPASCTREVAKAEYDRDAVPPSVRAKLDARPDTTDTAKGAGKAPLQGPLVKAVAAGSWSGSLKVNVEDPPQIDVTTTKSYLTWSSDDVYLYSDHTAEWGWFSGSGWGRESYDWFYDNNGSYAYTDSTAHYRNGKFCLTIDTHTYHNQTYFEGWYDGYWYWSYSVDKSGGCTDLLHYEYIADTP